MYFSTTTTTLLQQLGTTSGIGCIAAETVLNKSLSESIESFEKLQASVPDGKFVQIECDLQDFASVPHVGI